MEYSNTPVLILLLTFLHQGSEVKTLLHKDKIEDHFQNESSLFNNIINQYITDHKKENHRGKANKDIVNGTLPSRSLHFESNWNKTHSRHKRDSVNSFIGFYPGSHETTSLSSFGSYGDAKPTTSSNLLPKVEGKSFYSSQDRPRGSSRFGYFGNGRRNRKSSYGGRRGGYSRRGGGSYGRGGGRSSSAYNSDSYTGDYPSYNSGSNHGYSSDYNTGSNQGYNQGPSSNNGPRYNSGGGGYNSGYSQSNSPGYNPVGSQGYTHTGGSGYGQKRGQGYSQPTGPNYSQGGSSYSQSVGPTYNNQAGSSYSQPASPTYNNQGASGYSQPAGPTYNNQGASGYSQPANPTYSQGSGYSQQGAQSYPPTYNQGYVTGQNQGYNQGYSPGYSPGYNPAPPPVVHSSVQQVAPGQPVYPAGPAPVYTNTQSQGYTGVVSPVYGARQGPPQPPVQSPSYSTGQAYGPSYASTGQAYGPSYGPSYTSGGEPIYSSGYSSNPSYSQSAGYSSGIAPGTYSAEPISYGTGGAAAYSPGYSPGYPSESARSTGYTDPAYAPGGSEENDPYAEYPDKELEKYLSEILKDSSSEESKSKKDSSDEDSDERNSPESRRASKGSDESGSKNSKRGGKRKSRKKNKSGSDSKSKGESSEEYDYSEEALIEPTDIAPSKAPSLNLGSTPIPMSAGFGMQNMIAPQQAPQLLNNLLGNLLQSAIVNQQKSQLAALGRPTLPPTPLQESVTKENTAIGKELSELGMLIKTTFRKMASKLDTMKPKPASDKNKKGSGQKLENSRDEAYLSLFNQASNDMRRSGRSAPGGKNRKESTWNSVDEKIARYLTTTPNSMKW